MSKDYDPDFPDPCEYCPLMYLTKPYDCTKDCKELKEAMRHWTRMPKEKK